MMMGRWCWRHRINRFKMVCAWHDRGCAAHASNEFRVPSGYMNDSSTLPEYAELHALSNFSFQQSASHPQELVAQASVLGYRAIAITDECSMAGVVRAWEAAPRTRYRADCR